MVGSVAGVYIGNVAGKLQADMDSRFGTGVVIVEQRAAGGTTTVDLINGADAVVAAFASQFADPAFVAYVRTTDAVEIADDGHRAAETGRWIGSWKGGVEVSGTYMAAWRESRGQWLLERELYITLRH